MTILHDCFSQGRVDGFFKGQGNLDFVLGAGYESNPNYFAGTDKVTLQRNVTIYNSFLAYGITDNFDVNMSLPYIDVNGVEKGLQDVALYLKHRLLKRSIKILGINYNVELSVAGGYSSNVADYQTEGSNALGQQAKVIDVHPVIHFNSGNALFGTIQGGPVFKSDPVPNSYNIAAKVGIAKSKYYYDFWYEYQYSDGNFDYRGSPSPPTFRALSVSYLKIGGTFYKPLFKHLGAYLGTSYVLTGRNVSQGFGVSVGIVLKYFKKEK